MKFPCTLEKTPGGLWSASSAGTRFGSVQVTAPSREEALAKLRAELRYRVELCPCSGVPDDYVELELAESR